MAEASPTRIADGFPGQRMVVLPRAVVSAALGKPVTAELLPTDVGHFPRARRHAVERPIPIATAVLIYCVRGSGWARVGRRNAVVSPGELLLVPPGQPHAYGADRQRPWTIYWIHLAGRSVAPLLGRLREESEQLVIAADQPERIVPLFERIIDHLDRGYATDTLLAASLTAGHLVAELLAARAAALGRDGVPTRQRIDHTLDLMRQSISTGSLRVADLAAAARLSPSHYAAEFRRRTGYAVHDYFTRLKMQEACRLLDTTEAEVKEIAARLGYDDPLYFSRVFRRVLSLPPTEYRATRKG
jgi:AraC-like DNA-binding protein